MGWHSKGGGVKMEYPWIWDNSNGYKVVKLIKQGQSIVSLWPMCSVCNTTALLCARLCYMKTGQEEEEEETFVELDHIIKILLLKETFKPLY